MKSYKSFTGAEGGLAVLPTVQERNGDSDACSSSGSSLSSGSPRDTGGESYPVDLLGMSWGSYLNSDPPTRHGGGSPMRLSMKKTATQQNEPREGVSSSTAATEHPEGAKPEEGALGSSSKRPEAGANEPHPLLQHLQGLMTVLIRSKRELSKCGLDVTSLSALCSSTLASHSDLKQLVKTLSQEDVKNYNEIVITSDLVHNLVEYMREALNGLISQGRKLNVQAAFLQQTARQLNKSQQEALTEHKAALQDVNNARSQLDLERKEIEEQWQSIHEAKMELKRLLLEAEESLTHENKSKGKMDSPHAIAQGRTQLSALIQTQKQQSRLEKELTRQQREIRHLQQAHDFTKSELLSVQDHATKLQRKVLKQISEVKNSESTLASRLHVNQESAHHPTMALDKEKRKSYHSTSKAQVKATLKGIVAAQKTLNLDIQRMQRQFSEQHATEQRLSRQLEESSRKLSETDSRIKHHKATIKGGRREKVVVADVQHHRQDALILPKLSQSPEPSYFPPRKAHSESVSLPKLHTSTKKTSRLPNYQFSKTELITLAKFDDHETAEQVMSWLSSQGKLLK